MRTYSRGEFLSLTALLSGAVALPKAHSVAAPGATGDDRSQARSPGIEADLVVVNANVVTIDPARPRAEAIAVKDGRFLAVGSSADIRALASTRTRVIDAAQQTVVPGFIDTHCHPSGVNELFGVVVTQHTTKATLIEALQRKAAQTPPGFWVEGHLFDDTKLTDATPLHRRDLDRVSTQHPVVVNHRGGHTSWYNSQAFELAGVTRNTADPPDGRFFRDATGDLTGWVAEQARGVMGRAGRRESFTPEQVRDRNRQGMRHISERLTAAGLTTVHDAGASADRLRAYEDARANGELRHRAYLMVRGPFQQLRQAGVYTGFGDEWIRIGGVKYGADGSASERTMRMSTPYMDTTDYGILTMTQQEIQDRVEEAHRANWQVGIHANGDVTIDMVLNAYERVLKQWPHPDRRHRIEHCTLVNPSLLSRIKATGTIPTPFWTYVYYHGEKWGAYGDDKMRWMFAHRSFLDYGIAVPGASDYGPGPFEPLMAIQSLVTRRDYRGREWGANQRVTVDEALRIGTINGAHASYEEGVKGSITTGKYADFVMLAQDPRTVDPNAIKDIAVVRTVVGGKVVHPKNE